MKKRLAEADEMRVALIRAGLRHQRQEREKEKKEKEKHEVDPAVRPPAQKRKHTEMSSSSSGQTPRDIHAAARDTSMMEGGCWTMDQFVEMEDVKAICGSGGVVRRFAHNRWSYKFLFL